MKLIFCSSQRWGYVIFKNYNLVPYLGPQNQEFTWYVTIPHVIFCRFLRSKMEFGASGPQIGHQIHMAMGVEHFFFLNAIRQRILGLNSALTRIFQLFGFVTWLLRNDGASNWAPNTLKCSTSKLQTCLNIFQFYLTPL